MQQLGFILHSGKSTWLLREKRFIGRAINIKFEIIFIVFKTFTGRGICISDTFLQCENISLMVISLTLFISIILSMCLDLFICLFVSLT